MDFKNRFWRTQNYLQTEWALQTFALVVRLVKMIDRITMARSTVSTSIATIRHLWGIVSVGQVLHQQICCHWKKRQWNETVMISFSNIMKMQLTEFFLANGTGHHAGISLTEITMSFCNVDLSLTFCGQQSTTVMTYKGVRLIWHTGWYVANNVFHNFRIASHNCCAIWQEALQYKCFHFVKVFQC